MMGVDHAEQHKSKRQYVLELLLDGKWHPHYQLADIGGVRYGARIRELKRLGYEIETMDVVAGVDGRRYRLKSAIPGVPAGKKVKVFLSEADAESLLTGATSFSALASIRSALASFRVNKDKL